IGSAVPLQQSEPTSDPQHPTAPCCTRLADSLYCSRTNSRLSIGSLVMLVVISFSYLLNIVNLVCLLCAVLLITELLSFRLAFAFAAALASWFVADDVAEAVKLEVAAV